MTTTHTMDAEKKLGMSLDDMIKASKKANKPKKKPATAAKVGAKGKGKKKAAAKKGGGGGESAKLVTIKKKITKKGGKVVSTTSQIVKGKKAKTQAAKAQPPAPMKLFVSNLDYGVTNKDLKELFGECGPLKSFNIHFNANGRSQGTADVVFRDRADALRAKKMYNGRTLDGRMMEIQALNIPSATAAATKKVLSSGKVVGKPKKAKKPRASAMDMS